MYIAEAISDTALSIIGASHARFGSPICGAILRPPTGDASYQSIPTTNIPSETASTQKEGLAYPEFVAPAYLPAKVRTATRLGLS